MRARGRMLHIAVFSWHISFSLFVSFNLRRDSMTFHIPQQFDSSKYLIPADTAMREAEEPINEESAETISSRK